MRNQAQTHQVELSGSGNFSFAMGFEVEGEGEQYNNGVPYSWLTNNDYETDVDVNAVMAANGFNTLREAYIANLNPRVAGDRFQFGQTLRGDGVIVRFSTKLERDYLVWYTDNGLIEPTWYQGSSHRIQGTGGIEEWEDVGDHTRPHPMGVDHRFYAVEVLLQD